MSAPTFREPVAAPAPVVCPGCRKAVWPTQYGRIPSHLADDAGERCPAAGIQVQAPPAEEYGDCRHCGHGPIRLTRDGTVWTHQERRVRGRTRGGAGLVYALDTTCPGSGEPPDSDPTSGSSTFPPSAPRKGGGGRVGGAGNPATTAATT